MAHEQRQYFAKVMFAGRLMYWHRLDLKFIGRKFFGESQPSSPQGEGGGIQKVNARAQDRGDPKFFGMLVRSSLGAVLVKNSSR